MTNMRDISAEHIFDVHRDTVNQGVVAPVVTRVRHHYGPEGGRPQYRRPRDS